MLDLIYFQQNIKIHQKKVRKVVEQIITLIESHNLDFSTSRNKPFIKESRVAISIFYRFFEQKTSIKANGA